MFSVLLAGKFDNANCYMKVDTSQGSLCLLFNCLSIFCNNLHELRVALQIILEKVGRGNAEINIK